MEYVELGRADIEVSRLGFGGAPVGLNNYLELFSPTDDDVRRQLIAAGFGGLERWVLKGGSASIHSRSRSSTTNCRPRRRKSRLAAHWSQLSRHTRAQVRGFLSMRDGWWTNSWSIVHDRS
jgi:hypothetical protein